MRAKAKPKARAKARHEFLRKRNASGLWMVIRLDDYAELPHKRGQFYPSGDDQRGGLWPTEQQAIDAAKWAMRQSFGGELYGILKLATFVERSTPPIKLSKA